MKYVKAPTGHIVKPRAQYCFLNCQILSSSLTMGFAPGPHWRHSPQTYTIGLSYHACYDSRLR